MTDLITHSESIAKRVEALAEECRRAGLSGSWMALAKDAGSVRYEGRSIVERRERKAARERP